MAARTRVDARMTVTAEFARTSVDGVPAFWTQAGDGMLAGLVFRVGRADESLARSGITHLTEHLALYPLGADARMHYNGEVDAITTTFLTRGSPEEIAVFFQTVCASLRDLPVKRLAAEKQVLRTEASGRRLAMTDPLFLERYGAHTYGLVAYPEFGVASVQASDLTSWVGRYFTRGNAALWLAGGPPPDGLRLDLPDGPAWPAPVPEAMALQTPAYANAPVQGVSWSALVHRSVQAQVYARLLGRRLRQELRHKQALAYSPAVAYTVRDHDMAHVLAAADGLPEVHSLLVPAFLREIERLAETEVTEEDLSSVLSSLITAADTPRSAAMRVKGAARDAIMGRPIRPVASWKEDVAAVSASDVREVAKAALASSLFVLPLAKQPSRAQFTHLDGRSETAVTGHRIRSADYPLDRGRLIVGADGVSMVHAQVISTVRFAQCAALLKWPDGMRQLIGRDGTAIRIEPTLWRMKQDSAPLEAMVPAERRVEMPSRPAKDVPRPWTRRRTRVAAWILIEPVAAALAGVAPVLVLLVLLTRLVPAGGAIAAVILFPALVIGAYAGRLARHRLLLRAAAQNARGTEFSGSTAPDEPGPRHRSHEPAARA